MFSTLLTRIRARPHLAMTVGVGLVAAYLCLVNLDYATLWHDEAPAATIGKNLLQQGDITGWDGRNLVGGTDGRTLNEDLRDVLPPLMYVVNAAGFAIFGVNETGARALHALIGIAALVIFFLILRQRLPDHPRLQLFIFTFAALSAQLLLYFRQSRYFALLVFLSLLMFWLYGRYRESRHPGLIAALALVAALLFFSHYTSGVAAALALAAYHLLFHRRDTIWREWAWFAACGVGAALIALGYLYWIGLLGDDRGSFTGFAGQLDEETLRILDLRSHSFAWALKLWAYARELFTADWISWSVFLWFAATFLLTLKARGESVWYGKGGGVSETGPGAPLEETGKIILFGGLIAFFSALLSPQPIELNPTADLRYYVAALPLLLAMKGLFVEWLWIRHAALGAAAFFVLLFTSAGAWPFNIHLLYTGERALGWHLPMFVKEVHRPYRGSTTLISDFLLRNARKDDLVYVQRFFDRETLNFYVGDHVLFCCQISEETPHARSRIKALRPTLLVEENQEFAPEWIIRYAPVASRTGRVLSVRLGSVVSFASRPYEVVAKPNAYHYPTQRPELNMHAFTPLERTYGPYILRRVRK